MTAIIIHNIDARMFRVDQIPNGSKFNCANCHINANGGGARNAFGKDVEKSLVNGNVKWDSELASIASDGDGYTNGQELLDPDGEWMAGNADPGNPNNAANPGDDSSTPIINSIEEIASNLIQVNPNPVKESAVLSFSTSRDLNLEIKLLSLSGVVVKSIYKGSISAGEFRLNWQPVDDFGSKLPSGVYLVSIISDGQSIARKVIID